MDQDLHTSFSGTGTPGRPIDPIVLPLHRPATRPSERDAGPEDMVFVRDRNGLQRVCRSCIGTLHADGNYVELRTPDKRYVLRTSLRDLIVQLGGHLFVQVNRNTAVNVQRLDRVDNDSVEVEGLTVTLSRNYRAELLQHLHVLCGR